MSTLGINLHFQCSFELRAEYGLDEPWTALLKTLRQWISEAPRSGPPTTNPAFYGAWFFLGGEWKGHGGNHHLVTRRVVGSGSDREPQHWALRYEHGDDDPGRIWRIDVGVSRLPQDGHYRFSVITSHYLRAGFIGVEPPSPLPTAPRVVGWLLGSSHWSAWAGSERLHATPQILREGGGEEIRGRLEDSSRECPLVVVSREFSTGQVLLDSAYLSRLLAGTGSVYECESAKLDKELEWCLGLRFSCWNGMARIYQPMLNFSSIAAPRKQRYFRGKEIKEQGSNSIIEMIVRGIARRVQVRAAGSATSIDDVISFERDMRVAELKSQANDTSSSEWIALLEESNSQLESSVAEKTKQMEQLQETVADAEEKVARLEYEKKALLSRVQQADSIAKGNKDKAAMMNALTSLPADVPEVVELIRRIHTGRIAFTDRAVTSAKECKPSAETMWKCLWSMAKTLYDLFFNIEGGRDLERMYQEASGFRLAMTEGELTKEDAKLMSMRNDMFRGSTIECVPHVKVDKSTTRVYFCPYKEGNERLIVVSFLGHLNTAGTRRRKD